ncbi:unnamed protein product [marine sediment metagenome]|uniref:Uncharacterized protein n=1 Tax=marine sediment metagenome TaxID=412755 RepID=X1C4Y1_9ZZZZ
MGKEKSGKILEVNLKNNSFKEIFYDKDLVKTFLGAIMGSKKL